MLCMFDNNIQQMIAYLLSVGMEEDEIYKQIVIDGEPTKYYLSNYGKVITLCSGKAREKQLQTDTKGYSYVDLYHHGKRHRYRIHKLVGEYYLRDTPLQGEELHHCDTNRKNNNYRNLVYLPKKYHEVWHRLNKQEQEKNHAGDKNCS